MAKSELPHPQKLTPTEKTLEILNTPGYRELLRTVRDRLIGTKGTGMSGSWLQKHEAEVMVVQTLSASKVNEQNYGIPFSFVNIAPDRGTGLAENSRAYRTLLDGGLLVEDEYLGRKVVLPAMDLLIRVDTHLRRS
jgi:hypothetical protein